MRVRIHPRVYVQTNYGSDLQPHRITVSFVNPLSTLLCLQTRGTNCQTVIVNCSTTRDMLTVLHVSNFDYVIIEIYMFYYKLDYIW